MLHKNQKTCNSASADSLFYRSLCLPVKLSAPLSACLTMSSVCLCRSVLLSTVMPLSIETDERNADSENQGKPKKSKGKIKESLGTPTETQRKTRDLGQGPGKGLDVRVSRSVRDYTWPTRGFQTFAPLVATTNMAHSRMKIRPQS